MGKDRFQGKDWGALFSGGVDFGGIKFWICFFSAENNHFEVRYTETRASEDYSFVIVPETLKAFCSNLSLP